MEKQKPVKQLCGCCVSAQDVFNDLLNALERLHMWDDSTVKTYMTGYRNALNNAQNRLKITSLDWCVRRHAPEL